MPKGQSNKPKAPKRPPAQVFVSKMENTYKTYLVYIAKVRSLAKHRALKDPAVLAAHNRFVSKMLTELEACKVSEAQAGAAEEQPELKAFIS